MKIGQASAASGCHIETIRYYERIGLLRPPLRTENGYRHYAHDEVSRLGFITRAREMGFTLEEIRSLLALAEDASLSCSEVDRLARDHLAVIEDRQRQLRRIGAELRRTISDCAGGVRGQCTILGALQRDSAPRTPETRGTSCADESAITPSGAV